MSVARRLDVIAAEMERLVIGRRPEDPEADHSAGDGLLLDALRAAATDETRSAIERIVDAWNAASGEWWWS